MEQKIDIKMDVGPMIERAIAAAISQAISGSYGSGSMDISKELQVIVNKAFTTQKIHIETVVREQLQQAIAAPTFKQAVYQQAAPHIAQAVVAGMGTTFKSLGMELGRSHAFANALIGHVKGALKNDVTKVDHSYTVARQMAGALGQASFALRELLPDDPDSKYTVGIINAALAKYADIDQEWIRLPASIAKA